MLPNFGNLMKQMQEDMQKTQAQLAKITVEGTAGGASRSWYWHDDQAGLSLVRDSDTSTSNLQMAMTGAK